jgi:cystathionine beta-lyase
MPYGFEFFDAGLDRNGTDCVKWDTAREEHGRGILPYWIADMDFRSPPAVQAALLNRAAHPAYGYTSPGPGADHALCAFWKRRHHISFSPEEVVTLPCVVSGLLLCVQAFAPEGSGVVIQPPVYGPFFSSVIKNNRRVDENPLIRDASGAWRMDLVRLETHFRHGAKLMFLCSPHNPIARVWRPDELEALTALCARYDVILVSDEIHADFVYAPHCFRSALDMGYAKTIALFAASKTFNTAGLMQASLVTHDPALREAVAGLMDRNGVSAGNLFALRATQAAYEQGDDWLDGLIAYLRTGRDILLEALERELPRCRVAPVEATYLAFLDLSAYGLSTAQLMTRTIQAHALFTEGVFFSEQCADGWLRFNFACPHRLITEGVRRLKMAVEG